MNSYYSVLQLRAMVRTSILTVATFLALGACTSPPEVRVAKAAAENSNEPAHRATRTAPLRIVISAKDQTLTVLRDSEVVRTFPVSTSMHGLSNQLNSGGTPTGRLAIGELIGDGQPTGMVFVDRLPTGEIVEANAPGRFPITTRIIRLKGLELKNLATIDRYIYIHGSPAEDALGKPASGGCIRMKSDDVVWLFDRSKEGDEVFIFPDEAPVAVAKLGEIDGRISGLLAKASTGDIDSIRQVCIGSHLGAADFAKDPSAAAKWCSIGEEQLDAPSSVAMAEILERGDETQGIPARPEKSRELYLRASFQGNGQAMFNLHKMYVDGTGGPRDLKKAKALLEEAARRGHSLAKTALVQLASVPTD